MAFRSKDNIQNYLFRDFCRPPPPQHSDMSIYYYMHLLGGDGGVRSVKRGIPTVSQVVEELYQFLQPQEAVFFPDFVLFHGVVYSFSAAPPAQAINDFRKLSKFNKISLVNNIFRRWDSIVS